MLRGGIENDRVVCPVFGKTFDHRCCQVAVNIDDRQSPAGNHVLVDEIQEKRGLAGARRADDVEMASAGISVHADSAGISAKKKLAEGHGVWLAPGKKVWRWLQFSKLHRLHPLGCDGGGRWVKERCDFLVRH